MLSGMRIKEEVAKGNIIFDPYDAKQVNPNSYNVKLHNKLLVYKNKDNWLKSFIFRLKEKLGFSTVLLDMKEDNLTECITIPDNGLWLHPGVLYLGRTVERTETYGYVPCFDGRSSIGRLGISVHETAGFGDEGFRGFWTLEMSVIHPTKIYPYVEIGQIYFEPIERASNESEVANNISYHGKYQDNDVIQSSKMWMEFKEK